MARITVEDCVDKFESRFELVLIASNRARKLHSGENPTVAKNNDKNTVIALREIADETLNIDDMKKSLIEEYQTVSFQSEEDLSLEYSDSDEVTYDSESKEKLNENQQNDSFESSEIDAIQNIEDVNNNEDSNIQKNNVSENNEEENN